MDRLSAVLAGAISPSPLVRGTAAVLLGGDLCLLLLASFGAGLLLLQLLRRVHAAAAILAAAVARSVVVTVIEPVVVGEFFAGLDVANAGDEDAVRRSSSVSQLGSQE